MGVNVSPLDRAGLRGRVDKALSQFLERQRARLTSIDDALSPVADTLEEFVLGGGKRLRPARLLGLCGGLDCDEAATVAALELVQASALVRDDVVDRSTRVGAGRRCIGAADTVAQGGTATRRVQYRHRDSRH